MTRTRERLHTLQIRSDEMKDVLFRVQSLYKRQNFRLALEILESNVDADWLALNPVPEQLGILDLLASLCEKQGFLGKARKHAVHMVKLDDRDPRGYLRLGKILQLIPGKASEAVRVYERALRKVRPLAPNYQSFLEKQMSACRRKAEHAGLACQSQCLGKCDFVPRLPPELLILIFAQLSLRQRVKCTLVSKSWFAFLNSEPSFWANLEFSADPGSKPRIVGPETVLKYSRRSSTALDLDFQEVFVKDPESMFKFLLPAQASRLRSVQFNTSAPVSIAPALYMIRHLVTPQAPLNALQRLRICSDVPEYDVRWCLANLPALEVLQVATTQRVKPQRLPTEQFADGQIEVACTKLRVVSMLGQCGTRVLSDLLAAELVGLPSLESADLHRVVPNFWPVMHGAVANKHLKRCGFTAEGGRSPDRVLGLPRFAGELTSITLNDMTLSCIATAPLLPDGTRYLAGSRTAMQQLEYVELKRVILQELNLAELLNSWGCSSTLQTLVVHDLHSQSRTPYPSEDHMNFEVFANLEVMQFTGMDNLSDDCLDWLVNACPNIRKLNLEGTIITGPKLVRLLQSKPSLRVLRCPNTVDLSADTIAWVKSIKGLAVYF